MRTIADRPAPLRVLTFTTLYPNEAQPVSGLFVEQRLRKLVETAEVASHVVAPVPWFPLRNGVFGRYATFARVPRAESRWGIPIAHPRYLVVPRVGTCISPYLLASAALRTAARLRARGLDFDLVDAHFYHPDGVAAAMFARRLGKPLVITARGSDINLHADIRCARRHMLWAAGEAYASVAVSDALRQKMIGLGMTPERIRVLRNGVDLETFRPIARDASRAALGWHGKVALSVGNLVELKGHHLAIEALRQLPDWQLMIAGPGEGRARLMDVAHRAGVAARVQLLGPVSQTRLPMHYSAADVLVLASSREGMPNVVLESMACGTPVVATAVGGIPEVVNRPEAGELAVERTAPALAAAIRRLEARSPGRDATRRHAEQFGWDATTRGQIDLFREAVRNFRAIPAASAAR